MDGSSGKSACSERVVSAIYQHIDGDDPWGAALEELRLVLRANYAVMRISNRAGSQRDTLIARGANIHAGDVCQWEEYFARQGFPAQPRCGGVSSFNWRDLVAHNPLFDQLVKAGCTWSLAHAFESSAEGECMLIASRDDSQAPFSVQDQHLIVAAGAHFQRAFRFRLEILNGRFVSGFQAEALERLAIAGFLVNQNRCTLPLNPHASRFIEERNGLKICNGALHASNQRDDKMLQAAIRSILERQGDAARIRGLSLRRAEGKRDIGVVISAQDSCCPRTNRKERVALIFVRDPQSVPDPSISLMQELFSFTRTEAVVAARLAKGFRLEDIEHELNIRHNTARAHLRSMFSKVEVHRQSQLVHLLANCVAGLGENSNHENIADIAEVSGSPTPAGRKVLASAPRFRIAAAR